MEVVSYSQFSQELHQQIQSRRAPTEATIEVTHRCPLNCAHCYNNLPMGDALARSGELTYEEHCRLLDELEEAGCLWLLYTGGEIFGRRDFLDIYTYAKRKGFLITLFTNGTLITEKIADYLAEWPPFAIEITLYGRTRETYERLTRIPGSFDKCMRGIDLLLERGLPLKLKTVAVTTNLHEVEEMRRFAEDDLGLDFKFDAMMSPRIDCSQSPLGVRLTPAETVELDLQDPRRASQWRIFAAQFRGASYTNESTGEQYHCGGGISAFAVDPEGRMSICVLSHADTYDLRRGTLREGWDDFLLRVRSRKLTRVTKCVRCEIKAMCGMCPATGELENNDAESPVDFLCHVAHLRAHAIGIEVPAHGECEYCEGGSRHEELKSSAVALGKRAGDVAGAVGAEPGAVRASRYLPVVSESAPAASGCSSGGIAGVGGGGGGCSTCH